jgi:transmembrane protein
MRKPRPLAMTAPPIVALLLMSPPTAAIARVLLTLPFWWSGLAKVTNFSGAVTEIQNLHLHPAAIIAIITIAVQLLGSLGVILGRWRWLAAGVLDVFTAFATLLAHKFWTIPDPTQSARELNICLEHGGLIGGFLLAAISGEMIIRDGLEA